MKINLPKNTFATFKIVSGSLFLVVSLLFYKVAGYALLAALMVGRAHSLGAWLAMWRSKKLNLRYVSWMVFLSLVVSFWGVSMVSFLTLAFITHLLFTFHFVFDEFELQEEKRDVGNVLASVSPVVLVVLFLIKDFFQLEAILNMNIFIVIAVVLFAIELIFLKEINWFFVQTKILTLFVLFSLFMGMRSGAVLGVFLIFHYFFWFIYPVYKLHKYQREERDGLVMILVLVMVVSASFHVFTNHQIFSGELLDLALEAFYIGTIVHILSTAPFGYFFGLPKPKIYS